MLHSEPNTPHCTFISFQETFGLMAQEGGEGLVGRIIWRIILVSQLSSWAENSVLLPMQSAMPNEFLKVSFHP